MALEQITMVTNAPTVREAFGISNEQKAEVLKKLIAVARIYPKYSVIAESFYNCSDRFTDMERLFGLFLLGKVSGAAAAMRTGNIVVQFDRTTMPLDAELLSLMSMHVKVRDPLMDQLLGEGHRG